MKILNTLFIAVFLCSCGSMVGSGTSSTFTAEKGRVPADFMKEKSTLVLLLDDDGDSPYETYLKKAFDEFYTGDKIYIQEKELKSSEYADLNMYRYTFRQKLITPTPPSTQITRVFIMHDRVTKQDFKPTVKSAFFAAVLKSCAQSLEETRIANGQ